MDMRTTNDAVTSLRILSCGWPLCGSLNAVVEDAVLGMRIGNDAVGLYGRYSCRGHAYGDKDTVDAYMRWLHAGIIPQGLTERMHAVPLYGMWYGTV